MKLSRMLVVVLAMVFMGLVSAGSAEAAQKRNLAPGAASYRGGSGVINGFSITFVQLLRFWKSGVRYWYD